jgi:hypothetical protein
VNIFSRRLPLMHKHSLSGTMNTGKANQTSMSYHTLMLFMEVLAAAREKFVD